MENLSLLLGILAGVATGLSYVFYIISILRKKTIPARASWMIWCVLNFVVLTSYHSLKATTTIYVPLAYTFGTVIIAILSIFYGVGGWTKFERRCFAVIIISLVIWKITGSALLALSMNILIDAVGTLPTIKKVYHDPKSEDKLAWILFFVGSFLNVLAINKFTLEIALYPIVLFIAIGTVFYFIFIHKRKLSI